MQSWGGLSTERRRWVIVGLLATAGAAWIVWDSRPSAGEAAAPAPLAVSGRADEAVVVDVQSFGIDSSLRQLPDWGALSEQVSRGLAAVPGLSTHRRDGGGDAHVVVGGTVAAHDGRVLVNVRVEYRDARLPWSATYWRPARDASGAARMIVAEVAAEIIRQRILSRASDSIGGIQ